MKITLFLFLLFTAGVIGNDYKYSRHFQRRLEYYQNHPSAIISKDELAGSSIDWRTSKLLRAVEDQGDCGSCYAFAATHTVQDNWNIQTKKIQPKLAVQSVLECINCKNTYKFDCQQNSDYCEGGWPAPAAEFLLSKGAATDNCMSYQPSFNYECHAQNCERLKPVPGAVLRDANFPAILAALKTGPVSTVFEINGGDFCAFFSKNPSGIYINEITKTGLHAVEIVGYNDMYPQYWIVKNSWGTSFADKGYFKYQAGKNLNKIEAYVSRTDDRGHYVDNPVSTKATIIDTSDLQDIQNDEILQAAQFALTELNIACNGVSYEVSAIPYAEALIIKGVLYSLYFTANVPNTTCEELEIEAKVTVDINGVFNVISVVNEEEMINFQATENSCTSPWWNSLDTKGFTVIGVVAAVLLILLIILVTILTMCITYFKDRRNNQTRFIPLESS